jgi:hypothetical protein
MTTFVGGGFVVLRMKNMVGKDINVKIITLFCNDEKVV